MARTRLIIAIGILWPAVAFLVWPHTSFSGKGADEALPQIEAMTRASHPRMPDACRNGLLEYARERMRSLVAAGYPSSLRYDGNAASLGSQYLSSKCAIGPFLGVTAMTSETAASLRRANGSNPMSSRR